MNLKKALLSVLILTLAFGFVFAGGQDESAGAESMDDGAAMEDLGEVSLAYVEWDRARAITHVAGEILDRAGFDVEINSVANAAMWQSVAVGDSDALLAAWLPVTHSAFYGDEGQFTDQVVDLGPNYTGARLGLVVPSYVDEDSIEDLVANAGDYDGEIIGIDPGAGMMAATEEAINNDTVGLGEFELVEGSDATMVAALESAIENEEPIVVTGWAPHIKFARFDLKILEDPAGIYGGSETINTIVREGLEADNPMAFAFFDQFDWQQAEDELISRTMVLIDQGQSPEDAAAQAVSENVDLVNSLLPDGLSI